MKKVIAMVLALVMAWSPVAMGLAALTATLSGRAMLTLTFPPAISLR